MIVHSDMDTNSDRDSDTLDVHTSFVSFSVFKLSFNVIICAVKEYDFVFTDTYAKLWLNVC